ncbi:MAG: UUP1 family membrane protein, partial [Xanthomonadales bacterium]|nr:UUP1 family membrane protein [Xanthomonadales bacterium]
MSKRHIYILAACLVLAGSSLFLYKLRTLGLPLDEAQETEVWTIEAHVEFQRATTGAVKARLRIPMNP